MEDVLDEVRRRNPQRMLTVHAIFLGVDRSTGFLKRLAKQNGGQFVHRKR